MRSTVTVRHPVSAATWLAIAGVSTTALLGSALTGPTPNGIVSMLIGAALAGWGLYCGTTTIHHAGPGWFGDTWLPDDEPVLIRHDLQVWLSGLQLGAFDTLHDAQVFAEEVGGIVDRPVLYTPTPAALGRHVASRMAPLARRQRPDLVENVVRSAPRRRLQDDRVTCWIAGRRLTLTAHRLHLGTHRLPYDGVVDVFIAVTSRAARLTVVTIDGTFDLDFRVPRQRLSPRYQQVVGELRWLRTQVLERRGAQPADGPPKALSDLRWAAR